VKSFKFAKIATYTLQPFFMTDEQSQKTKDAYIHLISKHRLNKVIRAIATLAIVATLLVPVAALMVCQSSNRAKITIVTVSVIVFTLEVSIFATPKNHELFAATAA
jgi:formate/nitrite transporter FocA (FNT family)